MNKTIAIHGLVVVLDKVAYVYKYVDPAGRVFLYIGINGDDKRIPCDSEKDCDKIVEKILDGINEEK